MTIYKVLTLSYTVLNLNDYCFMVFLQDYDIPASVQNEERKTKYSEKHKKEQCASRPSLFVVIV